MWRGRKPRRKPGNCATAWNAQSSNTTCFGPTGARTIRNSRTLNRKSPAWYWSTRARDEATANNSRQLADVGDSVSELQRNVNAFNNALQSVNDSIAALDREMQTLAGMEDDLESIRQALSSGDSTVLGLVGRLEYVEQSMESVNAHRLQINQSLFRLQEQFESLQTQIGGPSVAQ